MRNADIARLAALALIWSLSFVFIRVLVPVLGPVWVATGRVTIAGVALCAWLVWSGFDANVRKHWRAYLFIGVLNSAAPFLLFAFAALHLPASYLAILNAATPHFGAVATELWLAETLTPLKIMGLVAGIAGVALVSRAGPVEPDAAFGWAVAASLCAALCYALAAVWIRRFGHHLQSKAIAGYSQLFAGIVLLPLAANSSVPGPVTGSVVANLLALALLCSAVAYLLFYRLIADIGATRALTVTFLIPALGLVWAAVLLHETITWTMIVGAALVIGGTAAVLRPARVAATAPARSS